MKLFCRAAAVEAQRQNHKCLQLRHFSETYSCRRVHVIAHALCVGSAAAKHPRQIFEFAQPVLDAASDTSIHPKHPRTKRSKAEEQRVQGPRIHPMDTPIGMAMEQARRLGESRQMGISDPNPDGMQDE